MAAPSIVAPGGSLDKALIALHYGADAVYVGAQQFSLRKSAANLNDHQLIYLCGVAHALKKRVYLALNIFPHERDMQPLGQFLDRISTIPLDACIVSDIGVAAQVSERTPFPIHTSTQASVLNTPAAEYWYALGAKRVVLAREASLNEAKTIKDATGLEIELFIHGAMCSSFSGKCTISNVASGRDSNRGGCIQSCRHAYTLDNGHTDHIMNSKDLMGIQYIPNYIQCGIDAVKIEGRMKSALYVANACQQYRHAIDTYLTSPENFHAQSSIYTSHLNRVSNRGFTSASLVTPAGNDSISYDWNGYSKSLDFLGLIKKTTPTKSLLETKQPVSQSDTVYAITPQRQALQKIPLAFESLTGQTLSNVGPNQHVWLHHPVSDHGILVKTP
jgi:putative protease